MIQIFKYEERSIQFEVIDGKVMANATAMCQAFGKRPNDWLNLAGTKRYMEAVTRKNGNADIELVTTKTGGDVQGTWIHERLILKLAQWLDVDFELWCDERIAELLKTGNVSIQKPLSPLDFLQMQLDLMKATETRFDKVESKIEILEAQNKQRPSFFTIAGYASLHKIPVGLKLATSLGRKASVICKKRGITPDRIEDPRFGVVGSYPTDVLEEVFSQDITYPVKI
ncbi:KilA-N domain-containing protein [Dyadobacter sp. CY312]|uniref:KilA-N domain-containing protein n=1 Tax=Dyadobacter sp. CY312 TaxID=2907303 RepID=UPI001F3C468E|nr:KilA-N domain-containing protein [Dyadobacter sp. CY312]MCE7039223.1 KilA-N domain-containing protein [Dyadobacter sp. CY312]